MFQPHGLPASPGGGLSLPAGGTTCSPGSVGTCRVCLLSAPVVSVCCRHLPCLSAVDTCRVCLLSAPVVSACCRHLSCLPAVGTVVSVCCRHLSCLPVCCRHLPCLSAVCRHLPCLPIVGTCRVCLLTSDVYRGLSLCLLSAPVVSACSPLTFTGGSVSASWSQAVSYCSFSSGLLSSPPPLSSVPSPSQLPFQVRSPSYMMVLLVVGFCF